MSNRLGWDNIFKSGSVVDLDVKIWTARTGIQPQDWGIANSPEVVKGLALGCYRLAPKESFDKIREIAARAKRAVEYSSFNFALIRGARFTPDAKLGKLLDELRFCQREFNEEADDYSFREYDGFRVEMLPVLRKACQDASRNPEVVEAAFSRILSIYPSKEEVRKKFSLSWAVYSIRGAQSLSAVGIAEEETQNVKSIIRDMVVQLREETQERVGAVMASLAKGGKLPQKTIDATRETLSRVREMNIFGDRELDRMVDNLTGILQRAESFAGKIVNGGLITELAGLQQQIESGMEDAVRAAEETLVGLGQREIDLPGKGETNAV